MKSMNKILTVAVANQIKSNISSTEQLSDHNWTLLQDKMQDNEYSQ